LSQNGTFLAETFAITDAMFEEPASDQRRTITRTLTITTVETWTITIGLEGVAATAQPDRATAADGETIIDQTRSNQGEEK
jgi:hypothetical protein